MSVQIVPQFYLSFLNHLVQKQSQTLNPLQIQEALEFTASPSSLTGQDAYVPQFETARFPCTVRGTPGPQIYKWYRQKHLRDPFNGLPARAYMDEDKSLVIPFTQVSWSV